MNYPKIIKAIFIVDKDRRYGFDVNETITIANLKKMIMTFIKKLANKGSTNKFQMERGMSNREIAKSLGIVEFTVRYYRKRPDILE